MSMCRMSGGAPRPRAAIAALRPQSARSPAPRMVPARRRHAREERLAARARFAAARKPLGASLQPLLMQSPLLTRTLTR